MGIFPTQLSPEFLLDSSQPLARGRPMAYTVPNPDTSALSELQDIGFSAPSGSFPVAQDDLAHIASNFTSESQSAFHPANQSPCSGFHPPSKATGSSSSSFISLDDIKAFINRSANGYNDKNAIFQQIMKAGIEKLAETQTQSTPKQPLMEPTRQFRLYNPSQKARSLSTNTIRCPLTKNPQGCLLNAKH